MKKCLKKIQGSLSDTLAERSAITMFDDFYSEDDVESIVNRIPVEEILWFPEHRLGRIGFSIKEVQEQRCEVNTEMYFEKAAEVQKLFENVFAEVENPVSKLAKLLSEVGHGYGIANDPAYNKMYNYGVLEYQKCGRNLHVDNFVGKGLNLSFVVNLALPEEGGELVLYNRRHSNSDGYTSQNTDYSTFLKRVTNNEENLVISPKKGQAYLFNNSYYHLVKKSKGERYRVSFLSILKQLTSNSFVGYV